MASPIPEVAPVTSTRLPASAPGSGSAGQNLRRTPEPMEV